MALTFTPGTETLPSSLAARTKCYEFANSTGDAMHRVRLAVDRDSTAVGGSLPAGTWIFELWSYNGGTEERIDTVEIPVAATDRYIRFDDTVSLRTGWNLRIYITGTAGDDGLTWTIADEHNGMAPERVVVALVESTAVTQIQSGLALDSTVAKDADLTVVDTNVDAIKAKTDNLPANPAAVSDLTPAVEAAEVTLNADDATAQENFRDLFRASDSIWHGYTAAGDVQTTTTVMIGADREGNNAPGWGGVQAQLDALVDMEFRVHERGAASNIAGTRAMIESATWQASPPRIILQLRKALAAVPPDLSEISLTFPDGVYYISPGAISDTYAATVMLTRNESVGQDEYEVALSRGTSAVASESFSDADIWIYEHTGSGMVQTVYVGTIGGAGQALTARTGTPLFTYAASSNRVPAGHNVSAEVQAEINGEVHRMYVPIVQQNTIT